MYRAISEAISVELDKLEEKYSGGAQMSGQDLTDIDKMAHALKCLKTYEAMETECGDGYGRSRSRNNGRYPERDYDNREYRRY